MANLVDEILRIEQECDNLLAAAREKTREIAASAEKEAASERQAAEKAFEKTAEELREKNACEQKAQAEKLAREHAEALARLDKIPESELQAHVEQLLRRVLEC